MSFQEDAYWTDPPIQVSVVPLRTLVKCLGSCHLFTDLALIFIKFFMWIISFQPHVIWQDGSVSDEQQGRERMSNLPKVTQLEIIKPRFKLGQSDFKIYPQTSWQCCWKHGCFWNYTAGPSVKGKGVCNHRFLGVTQTHSNNIESAALESVKTTMLFSEALFLAWASQKCLLLPLLPHCCSHTHLLVTVCWLPMLLSALGTNPVTFPILYAFSPSCHQDPAPNCQYHVPKIWQAQFCETKDCTSQRVRLTEYWIV